MTSIRIVKEDNDFIVIEKPAGLPSAPLHESDQKDTAFLQASLLYKEIKDVVGKKTIEGGLVHRIDTATRGLLLIARNQQAFNFFQNEQKNGRFRKEYTAFCLDKRDSTFVEKEAPFSIESKFRAWGKGRKKVDPVTDASGKAAQKKAGKKTYTTHILSIKQESAIDSLCVKAAIYEGYRHQVRCHLAWLGLPVINDLVYNALVLNENNPMQFFATGLSFLHPQTLKKVSIQLKIQ